MKLTLLICHKFPEKPLIACGAGNYNDKNTSSNLIKSEEKRKKKTYYIKKYTSLFMGATCSCLFIDTDTACIGDQCDMIGRSAVSRDRMLQVSPCIVLHFDNKH